MTRQLSQTFQCLMQRDDYEPRPRKEQEFKPFRGGVLLFEYALDEPGEHVAWGAWAYHYTPHENRDAETQDDFCPPHFKIGKFRDTQFWVPRTAYGEGPLSQGVFYNEARLSAQSIERLKEFCKTQGFGIANLDGFVHFVLLAPQPVRQAKSGGYVYRVDEPKLIFAYDLDEAPEFFAYGLHEARNTKYDRTRHGQPVFEMCECESKRRRGERIGPCHHASDLLVKSLGETYAVESARRILYRPRKVKEGEIICRRTTPVGGADWAIASEEGLRSARLLEFVPAERLLDALSVHGAERPELESVPGKQSVKHIMDFLGVLHRRYLAAREKLESYELPIPIWNVFSGGSLAKAMLREFGIAPFREQNPGFGLEMLSRFRAADYGGRIETLEVLKPILSAHLDFCSSYPAAASLLGIQRFLVAEKVRPIVIEGLPKELSALHIGMLFDRDVWEYLCGVCLVRPDGDFLPFRSSENFRVRTVEAGEPYFVALPDVVASILKTGRAPEVLTTIMLVPEGAQAGIRPAGFFGGDVLDPRKDDIFAAAVIGKQSGTIPKQCINALAFGVHGEINPERGPYGGGLTIYCAGRKLHRKTNRLRGNLAKGFQEGAARIEAEESGDDGEDAKAGDSRMYFPVEAMGEFYGPLATLVASGGRLLLQMLLDVSLAYELEHVYANTDCAILAYPGGITTREFHERICAVQSEFERLSPYPNDARIQFLQLKRYNRTKGGCLRPTVFFSTGITRYVEFSLGISVATIRHVSQGASGSIDDPPDYTEFSLANVDVEKGALEADCPRKILFDAWKVATSMIIDWQRHKMFQKTEITGGTFCTYLKERIGEYKHFHCVDDQGRPYLDRIVEYFDPFDPDDPNETVASWRQFVIGKEPRHGDDDIPPLFEISGGVIENIATPFSHEARPGNIFFQLYMENLWFRFAEQVIVPNLALLGGDDTGDAISEARRAAIQSEFHFICGVPLNMFEAHAFEFLEAAQEKYHMNWKNAERHEAKTKFMDKVRCTLGISAGRYEKIKRAVSRLKGRNDWLPRLDADDLRRLGSMMDRWRSGGLNFWDWRTRENKDRDREKDEHRKMWHARHAESLEAKEARQRAEDTARKRAARSGAAEKSKADVVSLGTLAPRHAHGKTDFRIGMAVIKWHDAEDAETRVLHPAFVSELAAKTLGLSAEERMQLFSSKGVDQTNERPSISMLDAAALDGIDCQLKGNDQAMPPAPDIQNPQQILGSIERRLAGTATLDAIRVLLSHLKGKGIQDVNLLNDLCRKLEEVRLPPNMSVNKNDGATMSAAESGDVECRTLEKSSAQINTSPVAAPS